MAMFKRLCDNENQRQFQNEFDGFEMNQSIHMQMFIQY